MADSTHADETYRSMISISVEGFITNGTNGRIFASNAGGAVTAFGLGLFLSTLCFAGSYLTQFALFNDVRNGRHRT